VHILTSYCVGGVQWLRIAQSKGYIRLSAFLPENWNSRFPKHCASLKN